MLSFAIFLSFAEIARENRLNFSNLAEVGKSLSDYKKANFHQSTGKNDSILTFIIFIIYFQEIFPHLAY